MSSHNYLKLSRRLLIMMGIQGWSDAVSFGDFNSYRRRFEKPQEYFAPRFAEAIKLGNEMIKTILQRTKILEDSRKATET